MSSLKKSISVIVGTRPEAVKLAQVINLLGDRARIIYSGQHFDHNMWTKVAAQLDIPAPDIALSIGGISRGKQIGIATAELSDYFDNLPRHVVVVQGDTNSALAGALAAHATGQLLVHIEAGMRSYDRRMPEEHNRVLIDHLADLCCAPTPLNVKNLHSEGIPDERIACTGNTTYEVISKLIPGPQLRQQIRQTHNLDENAYVVATFHRAENVDHKETLHNIISALAALDCPVVIPLHPRTRKRIDEFGLSDYLDRLQVLEPLAPEEFFALQTDAGMLISDSGGVQEEACVVRKPLVVVRDSTERPEMLGSFAQLVPPDSQVGPALLRLWESSSAWRNELKHLDSPYGDGTASATIVELIGQLL